MLTAVEARELRVVVDPSFALSPGGLAVLCRLRATVGAEVLRSPGPGLCVVFDAASFGSKASDRDLRDRDESMSAFV